MKKLIVLVIIVAANAFIACSQSQEKKTQNVPQKENISVVYRLYPTTNMWTFIKLNTRNGLMWQVQYSTNTVDRFETNLNDIPLVSESAEKDERFSLMATQNMWNFILLDQISGKVWQVQWSQEPENKMVVPIRNIEELLKD